MRVRAMIGGEIHYGRVQPRYWGAILDAARSLGAEVIGTYVMWDLHEVGEGAYDFTHLHAFLAEVEARGLKVLARPGPFFYAEWRNLGIPDHAVPFGKGDPRFRAKAARWIEAVMRELLPWLRRVVIAVQADNEIDPMPHFYGEDQGFAAWLQRRYPAIEELNAAWGTRYRSFDEPIPALTSLAPFRGTPRLRDSFRYRYDLATDYARWVVARYREHGCDVPVLLNTWPGVDAQHWRELASISDLYGIDPYPTNECRSDYRYFCERLRLLRSVTDFPYLAEFGAGVWHGMPADHSPDHYRLTAWTALAAGIRGWNWYMLANRDNWTGAPINERGVIRPELGAAFGDAVKAFHALRDAPPPQAAFGVAWSWYWHQIAQVEKRAVDDPLFEVLHQAGIDYDFIDVDRGFDPPKVMFFAGEVDDPARLLAAVEAGMHLVFFQRLMPGIPAPDGTSHPGADRLRVADRFETKGAVFDYRSVPGNPIGAVQLPWTVDEDQRRLMELAVGRRYLTGFHERRGRGTITVLGCAPSRDAIFAALEMCGVAPPPHALEAGVQVARRGGRVIVVNPGEARIVRVAVAPGDIRTVELPRCCGVALPWGPL